MWSASAGPGNGRVSPNRRSVDSGTPSTPGVSDASPRVWGSSENPHLHRVLRRAVAGDADQVQMQGLAQRVEPRRDLGLLAHAVVGAGRGEEAPLATVGHEAAAGDPSSARRRRRG